MIELRLTHPALDFWVDVRVTHFGGSWLAVADFASTPEPAVASRPDLAVLLALWPLGPAMARRLAARAALGLEGPLQEGRGGPWQGLTP